MEKKNCSDLGLMCCLHRLDGETTTPLVHLQGKQMTKITMGRQEGNDYILEDSPAVSRRHVMLEKGVDGWLISDMGSSNGIWVNNMQLGKTEAKLLIDKDIIEIGRGANVNEKCKYRYQFYKRIRVKQKLSIQAGDEMAGSSRDTKNCRKDVSGLKHLCKQATLSTEELRQKFTEQEQQQAQLEERLAQQEEMERNLITMRQELEFKMAEKEELRRTIEEQTAMKDEQEAKDRALKDLMEKQEEFAEKQRLAAEALEQMQTQLEMKGQEHVQLEQRLAEQADMEQNLLENLIEMGQEKEKLRKTVEDQQNEMQVQQEDKERALEEAMAAVTEIQCQHEDKVKLEMEKRLVQQNDMLRTVMKLQQELELKEAEKEKLQQTVEQKQADMQAQIAEKDSAIQAAIQRIEMEKALFTAQIAQQEAKKEEIVTGVEGVMEDELVCAICHELLVQASSLNCAHSFCSYCIQKWIMRKNECPNCRAKITSVVRSIVLDNYINKVVAYLSEDVQSHRKEMIIQRKVEEEAFEKEKEANVVVIDDEVRQPRVTGQQQIQFIAQTGPRNNRHATNIQQRQVFMIAQGPIGGIPPGINITRPQAPTAAVGREQNAIWTQNRNAAATRSHQNNQNRARHQNPRGQNDGRRRDTWVYGRDNHRH